MTGEPSQKKKVSFVTLIATAAASVTSMLAGSAFGTRGTLIGVALGSVISGMFAIWYENMALHAHDRLRGRLTPADEDATSLFPKVKVKRRHRPWLLALSGLAMALASAVIAVGALGIVRAAAGPSPAGHSTPQPPPAVTVTQEVPSPAEVTQSPSGAVLGPSGASPDASPSSSPQASPSPSSPQVSTAPFPSPGQGTGSLP